MDSLEWRILDRVSSRNFILEGSSRVTWPSGHGEGRVDLIIMGGSCVSFFLGGGGGGGGELLGGGGSFPCDPPLLDETLLEGIMKNPMEPCTCCCCITHRR